MNGRDRCGLDLSCLDEWTRSTTRSQKVKDVLRDICAQCANGIDVPTTDVDACTNAFFDEKSYGRALAPYNDDFVMSVLGGCITKYADKPLFCAASLKICVELEALPSSSAPFVCG